MNEQNNPRSIEPTQNSKNIWIIIISVIFTTTLVVGSGVYAWQRSVLKTTEQSLKEQIDFLQKEVENLNLGQPVSNNSSGENLKSYTSDNFGIKFSFPNIWFIKENNNSILIERFVETGDQELEIFFAKFEYIDDLNNIGGTINGEPISVDINSFDTININGVLYYKGNCFWQSCMGNEEFYLTKRSNDKYLLVEIKSGFTDDFEKMVNSIEFIKK